MTKKQKKGFTLTELIVVIAIIAILAAVLIPTSISFIKKAKISADTQEVAAMNRLLSAEALSQDIEYFDIYGLNDFFEESDFDLKVSSRGYSIWYDRSNNKLVLEETDKILSEVYSLKAGNKNFTQDQVESVSTYNPSFLYISGDTKISNAVSYVRNFINESNKSASNYTNKIDEYLGDSSVKTYLNKYSPSKTLYVNNESYFIDTNNAFNVINNIVFTLDINTIPELPAFAYSNDETNNTIEIPSSVSFVQAGALNKVTTNVQLECDFNKVIFDEGSTNTLIQYFNPLLKEGSKISFEECFDITYENADVVYYYLNNNLLLSNTFIANTNARPDGNIFTKPLDYEKAYLIPVITLKNHLGSIYGVELSRTINNDVISYTCKLFNNKKNVIAKFDKSLYFTNFTYDFIISEGGTSGILAVNLPFDDEEIINLNYEKISIKLIDLADKENQYITNYNNGFNLSVTSYSADKSYMIQVLFNESEGKTYTLCERKLK